MLLLLILKHPLMALPLRGRLPFGMKHPEKECIAPVENRIRRWSRNGFLNLRLLREGGWSLGQEINNTLSLMITLL